MTSISGEDIRRWAADNVPDIDPELLEEPISEVVDALDGKRIVSLEDGYTYFAIDEKLGRIAVAQGGPWDVLDEVAEGIASIGGDEGSAWDWRGTILFRSLGDWEVYRSIEALREEWPECWVFHTEDFDQDGIYRGDL